jgi:transcriptional pleiotropic regulator of transition state genes
MELRRVMGIEEKDSLEIYTESDRIILRKYQPNCQCRLCGGTEDRMLQTEYGPVCITCAKTVIAAVGGKAADR